MLSLLLFFNFFWLFFLKKKVGFWSSSTQSSRTPAHHATLANETRANRWWLCATINVFDCFRRRAWSLSTCRTWARAQQAPRHACAPAVVVQTAQRTTCNIRFFVYWNEIVRSPLPSLVLRTAFALWTASTTTTYALWSKKSWLCMATRRRKRARIIDELWNCRMPSAACDQFIDKTVSAVQARNRRPRPLHKSIWVWIFFWMQLIAFVYRLWICVL